MAADLRGGPDGQAERGRRVWYGVARALVVVVCRLVWRVRISGLENLPITGAYILAPVHRSVIDTLLCGCLTKRRLRFLGKESLWAYTWSARLMTSLGGIPVRRGQPDREALRTCEAVVRSGEPVVMFPEGTRQAGPRLHPLFEGAAFVAARTGVPIVPVGIGGSEGALPKGVRMVKAVRVHLVVGPPLAPPGRSEGSGRVARRAVRETTDALALQLQDAFNRALATVGKDARPLRHGPQGC